MNLTMALPSGVRGPPVGLAGLNDGAAKALAPARWRGCAQGHQRAYAGLLAAHGGVDQAGLCLGPGRGQGAASKVHKEGVQ